jgi:hypothetical protein
MAMTNPAGREPTAATSQTSQTNAVEELVDLLVGAGLLTVSFLGAVPGFLAMVALCLVGAVVVVLPMLVVGLVVGIVGGVGWLLWRVLGWIVRPSPSARRAARGSAAGAGT